MNTNLLCAIVPVSALLTKQWSHVDCLMLRVKPGSFTAVTQGNSAGCCFLRNCPNEENAQRGAFVHFSIRSNIAYLCSLSDFAADSWSGFQKLGMGFSQPGKGTLSEFNRQSYDCFQFLI